jgi:hypothetical protein
MTEKCKHILTKGANKGKECGKECGSNGNMCAKHSKVEAPKVKTPSGSASGSRSVDIPPQDDEPDV